MLLPRGKDEGTEIQPNYTVEQKKTLIGMSEYKKTRDSFTHWLILHLHHNITNFSMRLQSIQ